MWDDSAFDWLFQILKDVQRLTIYSLHSENDDTRRAKTTTHCRHILYEVNKLFLCVSCFQRVALFSAYSMSAMCEAGFDVIDVYPLSDSYPPRCRDHVHYDNKVFDMMETMLEQYKVHDNKKLNEDEKHDKIKRCKSTKTFWLLKFNSSKVRV